MVDLNERRARLSREKQELLRKRLLGVAATEAQEGLPSDEKVAPLTDLPSLRAAHEPPLIGEELWRTLVTVGRDTARQLAAAPSLAAEVAAEADLDRLAVAAISVALARLGTFRSAGEKRSIAGLIEGCGIAPHFAKVLRRWLESLVEDGLLAREGAEYVALVPLPPPALVGLLGEEQHRYYGENLPAVLTGKVHPLEFYLPGGSSQRVEDSYRDMPVMRYCNGISEAVVGAQVAALGPETPVRILEVGAGTGGTTASLLPLLAGCRTVYVYTDVSKFFTDLGSHKFRDYPFLRYRELDIERHPREQGFPAASFDWVVAAHVLHATRNLDETLEHVRWLLAPGGFLLLLEETRFLRRYNFSMGFLPGFDHFEDYHLRPLHPLLPSERWSELLLAHGFAAVSGCTEPGAAPERLGVDVILARASLEERDGAP